MNGTHKLHLSAERCTQRAGQYCDAVFFTFAISDENLVHPEINVLDAKANALEEAKPGAVHERSLQPMRSVHVVEDGESFFVGEDNRQVPLPVCPRERADGAEFLVQHIPVEEKDGVEGNVLR